MQIRQGAGVIFWSVHEPNVEIEDFTTTKKKLQVNYGSGHPVPLPHFNKLFTVGIEK